VQISIRFSDYGYSLIALHIAKSKDIHKVNYRVRGAHEEEGNYKEVLLFRDLGIKSYHVSYMCVIILVSSWLVCRLTIFCFHQYLCPLRKKNYFLH
jgi:hypothetical protein